MSASWGDIGYIVRLERPDTVPPTVLYLRAFTNGVSLTLDRRQAYRFGSREGAKLIGGDLYAQGYAVRDVEPA